MLREIVTLKYITTDCIHKPHVAIMQLYLYLSHLFSTALAYSDGATISLAKDVVCLPCVRAQRPAGSHTQGLKLSQHTCSHATSLNFRVGPVAFVLQMTPPTYLLNNSANLSLLCRESLLWSVELLHRLVELLRKSHVFL